MLVSLLILVLGNFFLIMYAVANHDKVDSLHDQLLISESKLEQLQGDYKDLLEKVNGHPDFKPYVIPNGKLGDK